MSVIKVQCKNCHHENQVEFSSLLGGKRIMFKCQNKSCGEKVSFTMPREYLEDRSTLIFGEQEAGPKTAFLLLESEGQSYKYLIQNGIQVIGRKSTDKFPDIELNTDDRSVSRTHCIIDSFMSNTGKRCYVIKENNSKNGTYLNGEKLTEDDEVYIEHGDEIQLGNVLLLFKTANDE